MLHFPSRPRRRLSSIEPERRSVDQMRSVAPARMLDFKASWRGLVLIIRKIAPVPVSSFVRIVVFSSGMLLRLSLPVRLRPLSLSLAGPRGRGRSLDLPLKLFRKPLACFDLKECSVLAFFECCEPLFVSEALQCGIARFCAFQIVQFVRLLMCAALSHYSLFILNIFFQYRVEVILNASKSVIRVKSRSVRKSVILAMALKVDDSLFESLKIWRFCRGYVTTENLLLRICYIYKSETSWASLFGGFLLSFSKSFKSIKSVIRGS